MVKVLSTIERKTKCIPFDRLPVAEKCCFCVPLRTGGVIIALICIFFSLAAVIRNTDSYSACYPGIDVAVTAILSRIVHGALFLAAIYYIYGVIKKNYQAAFIFLVTLLIVLCFTLAEAFVWMFTKNNNSEKCPPTYVFAMALFTRLMVLGYFVIIVNSFRVMILPTRREEIIRDAQRTVESLHQNIKEKVDKKIDKLQPKT